jgi:hypothetical protein
MLVKNSPLINSFGVLENIRQVKPNMFNENLYVFYGTEEIMLSTKSFYSMMKKSQPNFHL